MRTLGLDLGSRMVKLVLMSEEQIITKHSWHTAYFYRQFCGPALSAVDSLEPLTLKLSLEKLEKLIQEPLTDLDACVSTGYGRNNIHLYGFTAVNELKAHSVGAVHQSGEKDLILLDVGGQDVKIMKIEKGQLMDMNLNDKCAASCGRFLEQMAEVLDMPLDTLTATYESPEALSSTCAVFCESELIGKLAEGKDPMTLAAGVNQSLFKRLEPMLRGFEAKAIWLSGGVAHSGALRYHLKRYYDGIHVLPDSSYNGAIGCCQIGRKMVLERGV